MKFFFPDSSDHVDPSFNFQTETRSPIRVRQRDDLYAHEALGEAPYDGLLISKSIVERGASRYSEAQRQRLLRHGAPTFFRTTRNDGSRLPILGDCGAFNYFREEEPPYTVDEVLYFYSECRVDYGISVDHVILQYEPRWDEGSFGAKDQLKVAQGRQEMTLQRAQEFLEKHNQQRLGFVPLGVAQGWSPKSYSRMVEELQKLGYRYIAIGGLVPLKTHEILQVLAEVSTVREGDTVFHLLGVTRCENMNTFARYGVVSFDSTSPLRQAFKDMTNNYYTLSGNYPAIRVPQVDANLGLKRLISAGVVSQGSAIRLERACLAALIRYDREGGDVAPIVELLREYETLYDPKTNRRDDYQRVLIDMPWKNCDCRVCKELGIHVILFRGAERNRRRGFHNLSVFRRRLELNTQLDMLDTPINDPDAVVQSTFL